MGTLFEGKAVENTITHIEKVKEFFQERMWGELREYLMELPPPDVSEIMPELEQPKRVLLFRILPRELSSEVFSYLESTSKDELMKSLTDRETRQVLEDLSPDDRTAFLEELPGLALQRLPNLLSHEDLRETMELLGYPEESVGRLMTPDYIAVRANWTIGRALEHIRRKGQESETINVIYVTDPSWKLLDALELRRFIFAEPDDTVERIMDYSYVSIQATEDQENAVELIKRYDLDALPVTDSAGILLGIATVDDILDVEEEEVTEDFHKTAAVTPLKTSYRESSVWSLVRKRMGWLVALVFINLIASGIIAANEEILVSAIALTFFIPLLNAVGGNVGAQSATLVIRAQATGDLRLSQWVSTVSKELRVGIFLGLGMALVTSIFGLFHGGTGIALVVGLSMLLIVLIINIVGVALPFFLIKIRLDPAMASSPLITSVADAIGLLIYFYLASRLLNLSS
jgi:magnesium transporter